MWAKGCVDGKNVEMKVRILCRKNIFLFPTDFYTFVMLCDWSRKWLNCRVTYRKTFTDVFLWLLKILAHFEKPLSKMKAMVNAYVVYIDLTVNMLLRGLRVAQSYSGGHVLKP